MPSDWPYFSQSPLEGAALTLYATGTAPNYTFTLINPVQITVSDESGRVLEEIQAVRASTSGKLLPSDAFPQSSYVRWTTHEYTDCCLVASQRVYHDIPASGAGLPGTNYDQTGYGYDSMKRRNRVVTPGGTITFTVFDVRNALTDNTWYDPVGNVAKSLPAGAELWMKTTFDSLNRPTVQYLGYGADATYADIFNVTGDVVLQQTETAYDDASNVIQATARQRYDDAPASQTGALGSPSETPKARVTYQATYPDALGRRQATADYGTNGGTTFTRSATIPARSDDVLVTSQTYTDAGDPFESTDPAGMVTRLEYNNAGRRTAIIENYQESESSSSSSSSSSSDSGCPGSADVNRTTRFTYNADGNQSALIAENAETGNQVTQYIYGTTLADSDVASSLLLRSVIYPDSVNASDQVDYSYNRQAQRTGLFDQNGSIHSYDYDLLGRLTQDRVTQFGSGVDDRVRRIETGYEVRGLVERITSVNNATVGSGSVLNEVKFGYNDFGQSTTSWQAHAGAVDTMTTPKVQNGYANGSANTIRPTSLTYPNGRVLTYDYGTSGGIDDSSSRIAAIVDDDATHLADYRYLGLGTVVQQDSPEADLRYTLVSLTGSNDPDTGDIYAGMDRFGRIKDLRWRNTSSNSDLSRVEYGYDRASNRIWRKNPTDSNSHYDWLYSYDGLHRLKEGERGTLNGTQIGITNPQFAQCWTLDETGNWQQFRQDDDGTGSWTLNQQRSANAVNEITAINRTTGQTWDTPEYDKNGNMTVIPRPDSPHPDWANFTADQWDTFTADQWSGFQVNSHFRATYDAWNRLVKVTGAEGTVQENEYDGRGYRIVTKAYTDGTLSETRHAYFTNQWQCIEERLGTSTTPDRQFIWGVRYIDDLILRDRSVSGGTLNERLYALQDANWNVTTVVDDAGTVQERYEYDPYGVTTVLSPTFVVREASDFVWETTYAGYQVDTSVLLFIVRRRVYTPVLSRWLQRDPIEEVFRKTSLLRMFPHSSRLVEPDGLYASIPLSALHKHGRDRLGHSRGGVQSTPSNLYEYVDSQPSDFVDASGADRYITQFGSSIWALHVGVAVDTWACTADGWVKTGTVTYDFMVDVDYGLGILLGTIYYKGFIQRSQGMNLVNPITFPSSACQDRKMLAQLEQMRREPPFYSALFHQCVFWSVNAVNFGMGEPGASECECECLPSLPEGPVPDPMFKRKAGSPSSSNGSEARCCPGTVKPGLGGHHPLVY